MPENRLVSIYMPTRNRIRQLAKAVDSVLAQSYAHIDLIVVNDASTDDTARYLADRARADARLVPVSNAEARGAPASRNLAIRQSQGVFVTGLDDDDEFLPERVSAFVHYWDLLSSCGAYPACLYAQDIWLNNGARLRTTHKQSSVTADELLNYNYIGNQVFAPRAHFIDAGLFDEALPAWQDLEFLIRLLQCFGQAHLLDLPTYLFDATLRPDRISSQEKKIRQAFELVAQKHAGANMLRQKTLFLQMFQDGYDIAPGAVDWLRFLRWGGYPKGLLRMARTTFAPRNPHRVAASRQTGAVAMPVSTGGAVGGD
jgi:glycosyltransferase involved in cell wall biosynthesis